MRPKTGKILVVDDNAGIRSALRILLPLHFKEVETIASPNALFGTVETFSPDVVLLDMNFNRDINTGNEGLFWLSELKNRWPDIEVVLFTAYADIALAVEGMKRGAADFIVKPWDNDRLVSILAEAVKRRTETKSGHGGKSRAAATENGGEPMRWGNSAAMLSIRTMVDKVAATDATILITGENGVGKDMLATEIHRLSGRSGKPMVCVDLGAVTETLFESELFGHVKGAFTDAKSDHKGKFELADGGTIFLDEIGNIPLHLQAKLLRVLQNRSIMKVGGDTPEPIDIRLICATNKDLPKMVREGSFREDLFYRINTMEIHLPPLRERQDEILPLSNSFIGYFARKYGRSASALSVGASEILLTRRWNGNIRELRNTIEKAVIVSEGKYIEEKDLMITGTAADSIGGDGASASQIQVDSLEAMEERTIRETMKKYNDNLSLVAKSLGISRPTLYSKLKKYNI